MARKLLPDNQRLVTLREQGMTYEQIAQWVETKQGVRVSPASIRVALSRAGLVGPSHARYAKHLPWRVKQEHAKEYAARMLRLMGRRDGGLPISDDELKRLDSWLTSMQEEHAVVVYLPESPKGFYYTDGDFNRDGIPILEKIKTRR